MMFNTEILKEVLGSMEEFVENFGSSRKKSEKIFGRISDEISKVIDRKNS